MVLNAASSRSKDLRPRSDEELEDGIDGEGMVIRPEQELVDRIVQGELSGRYWLLNGPKVPPVAPLVRAVV